MPGRPRADPTMCRTIVVATKLDGKLAQFSMAEDLDRLFNPTSLRAAFPNLLGGPVFTSVPPVGSSSRSSLSESISKQEEA